jgi:hypothetical protein
MNDHREFVTLVNNVPYFYIEKFGEELRQNGYEVLRGKRLKSLKMEIPKQGDDETDFVTKITVLGIFDFRAFLNMGMLISESERARFRLISCLS